jgi:hypothetical protein
MKEDKPLPCPLCNHESELGQIKDGDDAGGYFIQCTYGACGISTPLRFACGDDPKPLLLSRWNTRARLALLESVLAEAKRECIMTPFCAAKIDATDAAQENGK